MDFLHVGRATSGDPCDCIKLALFNLWYKL